MNRYTAMPTQKYEQIVVLGKTLLDDSQCSQLISKYNTTHLENVIQKSYRDVLVTDIDILDIPHLMDSLKFINDHHFKFNLNFNHTDCFFGRYDKGMHYNSMHMDCIAGEEQRKLSFSLLLNDNFQGGDFITITDATVEFYTGKLIIFPSFMPHKVLPIEDGSRYVIFGWVYGPNFK